MTSPPPGWRLSLDNGGAGRDDLPGGDRNAHSNSLVGIAGLPDNLVVHPAHDYRGGEPSSLGRQKSANPVFWCRSGDEYARYTGGLKGMSTDWMKEVMRVNYACARDPGAAWVPVDSPFFAVDSGQGLGVNETRVATIPPPVLKQKLGMPEAPVLLDVREKEEILAKSGFTRISVLAGGMIAWNAMG